MFAKSLIMSAILVLMLTGCTKQPIETENGSLPHSGRPGGAEDYPNYVYKGQAFNVAHMGSNNPELKAKRDAELQRSGAELVDLMAALRGYLKISNGCLVVGGRGTKDVRTLLFPAGSYSWDNQTSTFTYRGQNYKIGDEVNWGGGESQIGNPNVVWEVKPEVFAYNCDVSENAFAVN
jgi:hypothetical protein